MANFSQPLLGAGAEAKNDWAKASAATSLTFTGEGEFRRGFEVEIGINALATADAGLSKFINATVRGNAFAEAKASLRCQLPLNLFDEFGITVGAQAVAQAAAGIQVGLGLSIGDFIALIRQNPDSEGLPLDLVYLLLEESTAGGNFEIHVSAAAMAYASILITGEIVKNPGFHILVEAGVGLAAGVGFSGGLDLGIRNFRRFYGRAVDRTVDSVVEGLTPFLSRNGENLIPTLQALSPAAKMSLRAAYEIGDYIAKNSPSSNRQGAVDLSNHCVGIILEEAQRFLFGKFLEAGLSSLERLVINGVPKLAPGEWEKLKPQRVALANVLYRMPAEPFQPTAENATYWLDLVLKGIELAGQLPPQMSDEIIRGFAIVFSAISLTMKAIESHVNQAQSYAFAIGAGRVTSPPPSFSGVLTMPLDHPSIQGHINRVLSRVNTHTIDYADLITYLVSDVAITTLRDAIPAVDEYLSIFHQPVVANTLNNVVHTLLQSGGAFVRNKSGDIDPQETLRILLGALDAFLTQKIDQELVPEVNQRIADDNLNLYFNEVVVNTLIFINDVAFQTVLDWEKKPVDQDAFKEALASVMTMLLGRSLVLVGDGFMAALQADMQRACEYAAGQMSSRNDPFKAIGLSASPALKALVADILRVGGEVFGPLPEDARRRLRFVLYDVMETLPPTAAAQSDFLENLSDQFFIPNQEYVDELSDEMLSISLDRFQLFVERVLQSGGEFILDAIEAFIKQMTEAVLKWAKDLGSAIKDLLDRIAHLDELIQDLKVQAQQAFDRATEELDALLEMFSARGFRDRLRSAIVNQIYKDAKAVLADNPVYRNLPRDIRKSIRRALKDFIQDTIEGPLLDPIFDAIGTIAGELDSILDDVQELNPHEPLGPQLLDLLVDRMEDSIRDMFGGARPNINVGFTVTVFGMSQHFSLGKVKLSFTDLFRILREAIDYLSFYESQLEAAAGELGKAFSLAIDIQSKQDERSIKHDERNRLDRIRGEFTAQPKTITILNPVQSLVYDDDVEVQINLGGVPASYLGLDKGEQQRVLIFLNGRLIPPQALARDVPFAKLDAPELRGPINLQDLARSNLPGVLVAGKSARIQLSAPSSNQDVPANTSLLRSLPTGSLIRSTDQGKKILSARPVVRQTVKRSSGGHPVTTTSMTNVLPGRRMTATKRGRLQQTLPAGTTLEFRADRAHLVPGTNTLVVVVIDPGGQRYQQAVSFGVTSAPRKGKQTPGARLPEVPGRKQKSTPALPANRISELYDRDLIASRLKKGQDFLAKRTEQHIKDLHRGEENEGKQ